jgi:hypothetical protein
MSDEVITEEREVILPVERAGRRSEHGSSADAWERREESERVSRAIAVLPPELQRRLADPRSVVSPLVVAEEARRMEEAYQALVRAILTDDDYAWYEVTKQAVGERADGSRYVREVTVIEQRKRKSAWRKLARYVNLDTEVSKEVIGHGHTPACSRIVLARAGLALEPGEDCGCPTTYARYHVTVRAWNGRMGFGIGIASRNERGFKAQDHSIPATAYTRALSRAISDLIGAGEGDAADPVETSDAPAGEPVARAVEEVRPLSPDDVRAYTEAWKAATDDQRRQARGFLEQRGYRDNFLATGGRDLGRVMELLGSPAPEGAPR